MKKFIFFLLLFATVLFTKSCSKSDSITYDTDSINYDPGSNSAVNLKSVTKNYFNSTNSLYASEKLNFQNQKLINSQWGNGGYVNYEYNNQNLVSKISEFKANGDVFEIIDYTYDGMGRITEVNYNNPLAQPISNYTFTYNSNEIIIKSFNSIIVKMTINSDKEIIAEEIISVDGNAYDDSRNITYTYENGNLLACSRINPISNILETNYYTYRNEKNDHNYRKFLFGEEWKMNSTLDLFWRGQNLYGVNQMFMTENLISSYINSIGTTHIDYLFNEENQLIKETTITPESINGRYEYIYEYN